MNRSTLISLLVIAVVLMMTAGAIAAPASISDQKGVLAGTVLANGLVTVGSQVREGDILVYVETLTGPAPAVRANADGRVREVLVKPGDSLKRGDTAVKIELAGK
ncbi:MAG: hypothetical protein H6Q75_740 [Firmicutes bacterium]|nr:hypothetical protein [Bacillota bacterium]